MTIWKQLIHNATHLSESLYQFAFPPTFFFLSTAWHKTIRSCCRIGEPRKKVLIRPATGTQETQATWPGKMGWDALPTLRRLWAQRMSQPSSHPTSTHILCSSGNELFLCNDVWGSKWGAAVIGTSPKGPVPCYLSVHLYLPSPGLGKLLSMEPNGHLWS